MKNRNGIPAWWLAGLLVAAVIAIVACGGGGGRAPTSPASTPVPTPTPTTPAPAVFEIDETTEWGDLVGQFSGAERECIRAELGAERYGMVLDEPAAKSAHLVVISVSQLEIWEWLIWECLNQATAVELLWANWAGSMGEVGKFFDAALLGAQLDFSEFALSEDCMRDLMAYIDFGKLLASGVEQTGDEYRLPFLGFALWMPVCAGFSPYSYTTRMGVAAPLPVDFYFRSPEDGLWRQAVGELDAREADCIRDALGERYDAAMGAPLLRRVGEQWEAAAWGCITQESAARLFAANAQWQVSGPWVNRAIWGDAIEPGWSSSDCARRTLEQADYPRLAAARAPEPEQEDLIHYVAFLLGLFACSPGEFTAYDNYRRDPVGAIPLSVGETRQGAVDYPADTDTFVFQAEAGTTYRIELITDPRMPWVALADSAGERLASSAGVMDYYVRLGLMVWKAPDSGEYRIRAGFYQNQTETGPYTLSLTAVPQP